MGHPASGSISSRTCDGRMVIVSEIYAFRRPSVCISRLESTRKDGIALCWRLKRNVPKTSSVASSRRKVSKRFPAFACRAQLLFHAIYHANLRHRVLRSSFPTDSRSINASITSFRRWSKNCCMVLIRLRHAGPPTKENWLIGSQERIELNRLSIMKAFARSGGSKLTRRKPPDFLSGGLNGSTQH